MRISFVYVVKTFTLANSLKMARLEIFAVSLILAVTLNVVSCSNDEIKSDIQVSVVPDMDKFLMANPSLKVQPLVKNITVNGVSPFAMLTYRLGRRIAGKSLIYIIIILNISVNFKYTINLLTYFMSR